MRARDARDLARLAQAGLRELTPIPLLRPASDDDAGQMRHAREGVAVAGVVLDHLFRALQAEAARKRARTVVPSFDIEVPRGVWVAAYDDRSGCWVASGELDARRLAGEHATADVRFVPWGSEVWDR